jgi:hypothetical protein
VTRSRLGWIALYCAAVGGLAVIAGASLSLLVQDTTVKRIVWVAAAAVVAVLGGLAGRGDR